MNPIVSHYRCEMQHNLCQFNVLNVKQCTDAPSQTKHANVRAKVYVRAKTKRIEAFTCKAYAKKENNCFKARLKVDVLID